MTAFRRTPALVALAVVLAGCGSTVQVSGRTAAPGLSDGGLSDGPSPASVGGPAPDSTGPGAGPRGSSQIITGPAHQATTSAPAPASSGTAARAAIPSRGRGYDATHVYLGFPTNKDLSNLSGGLGLNSSLSYGDVEADVHAILDDVNRHGGLFGRTVVPVFYDNKSSDLQRDPSGTGQADCEYFTQDHPVVAVVNLVYQLDMDNFRTCLAGRRTPLLSASYLMTDSTIQQRYAPHLYELTSPVFDRVIPVWLQRLKANGYFHGWDTKSGTSGTAPVKIGLLSASMQPDKRQWAALKKRLTDAGYDVAATFEYDGSSLDAESSTIPQAVLPFRSAGVTHVFADRASVLLFMQAAENQRYRPRYALTTLHLLNALLEPDAPGAQLNGALGIGWAPTADVSRQHDPGDVGPGQTACRHVLQAAHIDLSLRNAEASAYGLCDGVHLLVQAALSAGGLTAQQLRAGVTRVGASFASAVLFRVAWSADRTDQPGAVRDLGWDTSCSCFKYMSRQEFAL